MGADLASIVLPVKALLQQYKSSDSAAVKHLDLSHVQHSLDRLDAEDRRQLIPIVFQGCARDEGTPHAATMANIILRLLLDVRIPPRGSKEDEQFSGSIGLVAEEDANYLANVLGIFLRLRAPVGSQSFASSNLALSPNELALFPVESPDTQKIFDRLSELRAKAITFLASAAFTDAQKLLPAVYAAAGLDNRVASTAEEILKRSSVSVEDETLVRRLFELHSRLPAPHRTRILGMLSKSAVSVSMTDSIMAVVALDFLPEKSEDASPHPLWPVSILERTKLHKALFRYLSWVASVGPSNPGFTAGPSLIDSMRSYVETQGWPVPQTASHDDINLRSRAYETIGMLSGRSELPIQQCIDLAQWLFRSLSEDPTTEAVVNIDAALSSLATAVPPSVGGGDEKLKTMLLTQMALPDKAPALRSTRHAVVKWANQCLPFSDITGRWIDILAVAGRPGERNDVVELGEKGLDPWTYVAHNESTLSLPDWKEMMTSFFDSRMEPQDATEPQQASSVDQDSKMAVFQNFLGSRMLAYPVALQYCKHIIMLSALRDFDIGPDWIQSLFAHLNTDADTLDRIRHHLRTVDSAYIVFYLKACLKGALVRDASIIEMCLLSFLDIASLSPGGAIGYLTNSAAGLLPLLGSNKKEIRVLAARAFGILAGHPAMDTDQVADFSRTLLSRCANIENKVGPHAAAAEGALMALGYLESRCVYYDREIPAEIQYPIGIVVKRASPHSSLWAAALECFLQLWTTQRGLPAADGQFSVSEVVAALSSEARRGDEIAIVAMGRLAAGWPDTETEESAESTDQLAPGILGSILENLFALHEIKEAQVHFTVGDAITAAIARWDSSVVRLNMLVEVRGNRPSTNARNTVLATVLSRLLRNSRATKPSLIKASGIWLFCIVQYCSHLSPVQLRLREIQAAFMRILSSRDELVQETASRGLSLVYERGDAGLKASLVKDLVSAFTESGTQLKVDDDTELFDPGALPTGEGSSVTSYKDIVNLANEVGDQGLVYKFLSLAANAATWSKRSAFGRFGLSKILSASEVDPKLYPKLYRYRFDPNQNVRRSMEEIWRALVKDPNATIKAHFNAILEDLLKSILGREWRVREASCAAISDLIQGQPFKQYEKHYKDIWTAALKVLDDVKGSVRNASLRLCMVLSNDLVRQLEEGNRITEAKSMMKEALPFLLSDRGIESSVQDVRLFSAVAVLQITKRGGKALRPFIPDMVAKLLGLLSTIEPESLNYQYQRVGGDSRDQIDKLRSQMVNQSPIYEAIESSLRVVDAEVMVYLVPRLEATIKSAIGMPTKIGCAQVLRTLATNHASDVRPVGGRLLQLLRKQVLDRNIEVSRAYARASAYVIRIAPEASRRQFCEQCIEIYFDCDDEGPRRKIGDVVHALAKTSSDYFTAQEATLLPFAYLALHDVDKYTAELFAEVWNQHAGSSRTVVRYVPEIAALVERCLGMAHWNLQHMGALTVASAITDMAKASDSTGAIKESDLAATWPLLMKSLALKTFIGKEKLLEAYPEFVERGQLLWKSDEQVATKMKQIAMREAKRNNDEYRTHAFRCLWRFAKARDDVEMLQEIADTVTPYLDKLRDEDKLGQESTRGFNESVTYKTARVGLEAVARGYAPTGKADLSAVVRDVAKHLGPYLSSSKFDAVKREVWYDCVCDLMSDATKAVSGADAVPWDGSEVLSAYLDSLGLDQADAGTEAQRLKRVEAVLATAKAKASGVFGRSVFSDGLVGALERAIREERAVEVGKAWKEVLRELEEGRWGGGLRECRD